MFTCIQGFDLTFPRLFVNLPNKTNRKTVLNCHPPWSSDEENFSL